MNASQLLKHFDRISEASDAIPRLRRFILNLAVRGKLVEQDPNDEPTSELLKRIQAHKSKLAEKGKLHGKISVIPLKANDKSLGIPSSWTYVRFGEIIISRDGERIPVSKEERNCRATIYDYYGASGVIDKIDSYIFDKPLLLIGEDGANLINRSTPIAFIARGKYWVNNHAHVLDGISEDFLRYIELHINAIDLRPYVTGTAQPKMNQAKMNSIPIALPPYAEQSRIVAKVDELMALCDRLEEAQKERESRRDRLTAASLQRMSQPADESAFREHARFHLRHLPRLTTRPEHIQQLRQTILNLAVRGKLVLQDPNDEPTSELLKRIRAEQEKLIQARALKPGDADSQFFKNDLPFDIPPSWQWAQLQNLVIFGPQNGISPKPSSRPDAPKSITLTSTTKGAFDSRYFKRVEANIPHDSEFWLRSCDLLFQRGNTREYVGIAAYYSGESGLFLYPDLMMKVRLSEKVNLRYIHFCAIAPHSRAYFSSHATGAQATMPKINQRTLVQLPIPVAPFTEQHRIVAKVDELMSLCDRLEADLSTVQTESRRLLEALLHEALAPVA
jgi:type I restriction enzyme, S subunit